MGERDKKVQIFSFKISHRDEVYRIETTLIIVHCIFESWKRVDFKSSHNKKEIKISSNFYSRVVALILRENNASNLLGLKYVANGYKVLLVNKFYFHLYNLWDYVYLVFLSLSVESRRGITELWISCIFIGLRHGFQEDLCMISASK